MEIRGFPTDIDQQNMHQPFLTPSGHLLVLAAEGALTASAVSLPTSTPPTTEKSLGSHRQLAQQPWNMMGSCIFTIVWEPQIIPCRRKSYLTILNRIDTLETMQTTALALTFTYVAPSFRTSIILDILGCSHNGSLEKSLDDPLTKSISDTWQPSSLRSRGTMNPEWTWWVSK